MKHLNIRWRLTVWYGSVLVLLLIGFGATVYWHMRDYLTDQVDIEAEEELAEFAREVRKVSDPVELETLLPSFFAVHKNYLFELRSDNGRRLLASENLGETKLTAAETQVEPNRSLRTQSIMDLGNFRVGGRVIRWRDRDNISISIGVPMAPTEQLIHRILLVILGTGPLVVIGGIWGGYFLAKKALAPVESIRNTADQITASHLTDRIEVNNQHDELGRLATTFNQMLNRLHQSFQIMQQFTADAAHELRTPLAILRNGLEIALTVPRTDEEYREILRDAVEDTERLCRLVEQFLVLAREDIGLAPQSEPLLLNKLIAEVVGRMNEIAEQKGTIIEIGNLESVTVLGDPNRLCQLWFNLLENAVKHTPPGGTISVWSQSIDGQVRVYIEDTGCGIPEKQLPYVFDRFYRVDASRDRDSGSVGLGLAICKEIVRAHHGDIGVESCPSRGTRFTVRLPGASGNLIEPVTEMPTNAAVCSAEEGLSLP